MLNQQQVNKKQLQNKQNPNLYYNLLFYTTFCLLIWFFISLLIPVVYSSGGNLTPFYDKFNNSLTLAPFGIASVVVLGIYLINSIVMIAKLIKLKKHKYQNIDNKKINKIYYFILVFIFLLLIGFVIQSFIPPNLVSSINSIEYYTATWGYDAVKSVFYHNWVYYFNIVFFSLILIFGFFCLLVFNKINNNESFLSKIKENKETFKQFLNKIKEAKKQKQENKQKKKRLLDEEEALLTNLSEITIEEDSKANISQEELLEKINARNKIKNKILDNHKEQEKLKLFKKDKKEVQGINKRSTKLKKQEIAIPDKELEEIFKNLEID